MKIAFYTDTYIPNIDGVAVQVQALKKQLEKKRHYVHVFAPGTTAEKKANMDKTVTYHTSVPFPPYPEYKLALFPFSSISKNQELGTQIIHCHALATMGLASIMCAKTLRLPLIGTYHTMVPLATHYIARDEKTQEFLSRAAWKAIKTFYQPFDLVTAPSRTISALLKEHGVEARTVSNGVETDKFHSKVKPKTRRDLGVKNEKVFMFVGRITKEKNVDLLVKAFTKIRGAKLVIIGNGPAYTEVRKLVEKLDLGKRVLLTGAVPHKEVPHFLAASDWQISASTFETQGLGILEGMACGKPCIGANSLAIPETVRDNYNGFLFEPFDLDDLRGKIETAIYLPEEKYEKMSANAAETGKQHSIKKIATKWTKIYKSFL